VRAAGRLFLERELASAFRARWFIAYAAIFLVGGMAVATFGLGDAIIYGYRGYAKSLAGLVHLSLFFVPLMALIPAVGAIADERESGALEYLLSQPVSFGEVFWGKWLGTAGAVCLSIAIGLGAASAVAVVRGVPAAVVIALFLFVVLLALAFVALGFLLTASVRSRLKATTIGMILWLFFVALGTLGIMAAFIRWGLPSQVLVAWAFVNPVEAFRIGILSVLDPDLSILGPVGQRIVSSLGVPGTVAVSSGSLIAWAVVPTFIGWAMFNRPDS
jgi:ABC-2 type transport system permease protein